MTQQQLEQPTGHQTDKRWRPGALEIFVVAMVVIVVFREQISSLLSGAAIGTATTIFVSIVVQALPFLVLGVGLSAVIATYVPASFWQRALPKRQSLAVPVAGAAGAILPGCECASVPVASGLMSRGVAPAAALTFLLAAPAINPIVVISTLVAFPGQPEFALARFVASLSAAVIVGWIWLRIGKSDWIKIPNRPHLAGASRFETFRNNVAHDFLHAGGFLVLGALAAAALNVLVPPTIMDSVAGSAILSILAMAALAVILCLCSEADAFVAASFTSFSPTSKLVFLVVGPMVDLKLIALQGGTFGRKFTTRFAPLTLVVAISAAVITGTVLL
jgi:uncharacterized membrane protein YraQ (UPF0718 family)